MKPILFSTEMVKALLDGSKTQTRRVMKPQPKKTKSFWEFAGAGWSGKNVVPIYGHSLYNASKIKLGDILWVRETFSTMENEILYAADVCSLYDKPDGWKWKPCIFMPKNAARIFLCVTEIKCEQLKNISQEDANNEGVVAYCWVDETDGKEYISAQNYLTKSLDCKSFKSSYMTLWEYINGKGSWNKNPWVWVYTFKMVDRPVEFPPIGFKNHLVKPRHETPHYIIRDDLPF